MNDCTIFCFKNLVQPTVSRLEQLLIFAHSCTLYAAVERNSGHRFQTLKSIKYHCRLSRDTKATTALGTRSSYAGTYIYGIPNSAANELINTTGTYGRPETIVE